MSKILRKTQKIFAGGASNNGQFGSRQAGAPVNSLDPAILQALPAFNAGWLLAVISGNRVPPLEEFQALGYLNTYQMAYMFQEGIPEYDAGTTYFQNSIVKKSGTYQLYGSLTDNNTGNALTDATKWVALTDLAGGSTSQSLTANGYRVFGGGLIVQWGTAALASGGSTVALPMTFPNGHFVTVTQAVATQRYAYVSAFNNANLTARAYDTTAGTFSAETVRFISIGY